MGLLHACLSLASLLGLRCSTHALRAIITSLQTLSTPFARVHLRLSLISVFALSRLMCLLNAWLSVTFCVSLKLQSFRLVFSVSNVIRTALVSLLLTSLTKLTRISFCPRCLMVTNTRFLSCYLLLLLALILVVTGGPPLCVCYSKRVACMRLSVRILLMHPPNLLLFLSSFGVTALLSTLRQGLPLRTTCPMVMNRLVLFNWPLSVALVQLTLGLFRLRNLLRQLPFVVLVTLVPKSRSMRLLLLRIQRALLLVLVRLLLFGVHHLLARLMLRQHTLISLAVLLTFSILCPVRLCVCLTQTSKVVSIVISLLSRVVVLSYLPKFGTSFATLCVSLPVRFLRPLSSPFASASMCVRVRHCLIVASRFLSPRSWLRCVLR